METKTMLAGTFKNFLNGGAAAAGADGLEKAIRGIEGEQSECRLQLAEIPDQRATALLADNNDVALDALEKRESSLYREIEKGDMQIAELHLKLAEQRDIGGRSRLEKHQAAVAETIANLDATIVSAVEANDEMIAAMKEATRDLGADIANRFFPIGIGFAGLLNSQCLAMWRAVLQVQKDRNTREEARASGRSVRIFQAAPPLHWEGRQEYEAAAPSGVDRVQRALASWVK
jgi:hypothetical protein